MLSVLQPDVRRVTIVGGGFTGASAAVQLSRASKGPIAITMVEPRTDLGRGLAYSTEDEDHRLNAPMEGHLLDPSNWTEFSRWCSEQQIAQVDPTSIAPDGAMFVRRRDFGAFVGEVLRRNSTLSGDRKIRHLQDVAVGVETVSGKHIVLTRSGEALGSDLLVVATGNALATLSPGTTAQQSDGKNVINASTDQNRIRDVPRNASVLVVGSGLAAVDVLSTMLRSGHSGQITVISRRGLRPRLGSPMKKDVNFDVTRAVLDRIERPTHPYRAELLSNPTILELLRVLRARIRATEATGGAWQVPFDELRDVVWQVWPTFPVEEKKRFLRHLRSWWDVHRFRVPPQNDTAIRRAERAGLIHFRTARLCAIAPASDHMLEVTTRDRGSARNRIDRFDVVINCTGIEGAAGLSTNPFLSALGSKGIIRPDGSGFGFAVDDQCRPIGANGSISPAIRLFGSINAGTCGDSLGAIFIAAQIHRSLPDMLGWLEVGAGHKTSADLGQVEPL